MSTITFSGALENTSEPHLDFIREVLEKRGYKNIDVKIENVGIPGDNYVANVKRIVVEDGENTFKMIAKVAATNELIRVPMHMDKLFLNEHYLYTELLPTYQQLEIEANIPEKERFRFAACYGTNMQAPYEIILLEDLRESEFQMLDRFKPLSDDCIRVTLKNFAKFHTLSYVLRRKAPEVYKKIKDKLFDMWAKFNDAAELYFGKMDAGAVEAVEGENRKKILKGAIVRSVNLAANMAHADEKDSKYFVIQQGDSWTNNIMFRYDKEKLQESILIDYQMSKESNPVCDIHYLIFNCTDHKSRLQHFYNWINYYHKELDKYLSNFNLKASEVYPREKLEEHMKKYSKLMFGFSVVLSSMLTMKSDDAEKIKNDMETKSIDELSKDYEFDQFGEDHVKAFKERVEGVVDSYVELGLF